MHAQLCVLWSVIIALAGWLRRTSRQDPEGRKTKQKKKLPYGWLIVYKFSKATIFG
jgi:hypothetical protein